MEYFPVLRKKEALPFVTMYMKLEDIVLSKRQILYDLTYVWNLKTNQTNLPSKQQDKMKISHTQKQLVK